MHGLAFYAPTLWMNGWSMPWYARILRYIRPTPLKIEINLPEHEPYGIKDERIRSFVVRSMLGRDSSEAGVFSTPLRCVRALQQPRRRREAASLARSRLRP